MTGSSLLTLIDKLALELLPETSNFTYENIGILPGYSYLVGMPTVYEHVTMETLLFCIPINSAQNNYGGKLSLLDPVWCRSVKCP